MKIVNPYKALFGITTEWIEVVTPRIQAAYVAFIKMHTFSELILNSKATGSDLFDFLRGVHPEAVEDLTDELLKKYGIEILSLDVIDIKGGDKETDDAIKANALAELKKVAAITNAEARAKQIEIEAKKLGVEVNRSLYKDLTFNLENGKTKVFIRGEEINGENTLGMWFRVAGTRSGKYTEARNLAIRLLNGKVFAANHEGYLTWTRMGKISQHGVFLENNIPVIPTRIFYTKSQVLESGIGEEFGWPIIAKHEKGYQGKSVRKLDNFEELKGFVGRINEKNVGMFLWQKCLPTRWDLRIIVLDGKAIGAMKRSAVGDEFRSNFSLGGDVEPWNLSESDRILAEKVAKVCGLDYCGVDIMKDSFDENAKSYILEVNRQCQFQGFEKSTGINVAKAVVEMFLKRQ
jgi:RimK family alpha-L-glutamate ligase